MSQKPHRCRTWAPRGETPLLEFNFNWQKLSVSAGLTLRNFYFRLYPGAIGELEVIDFLKALVRHIDGPLMIVWDRLPAHRSRMVREFIELSEGHIVTAAAAANRIAAATNPTNRPMVRISASPKPNCRCHQPDQPPHGPHFRLTKKVSGKTVTETFSSPADRRKAERQVAEFHRFQQLSRQLLDVNESICRLRPAEDTPTPQEKKRPKPSATKSPKK